MRNITIAVLVCLLLAIGCTDDENSPTGVDTHDYTATFLGLPEAFTAVRGNQQTLDFTIRVRDEAQRLASDVAIDLNLLSGEGELSVTSGVSDSDGEFDASCTFLVPEGYTNLKIEAVVGGKSFEQEIRLNGVPQPAEIYLTDIPSVVSVPLDYNAEIIFTAVVMDEDHKIIPGIDLDFRLKSVDDGGIYGYFTDSEPTDSEGKARATFHSQGSFGRQIAICEITELPGYDGDPIWDERQFEIKALQHQVTRLEITANTMIVEVSEETPGTAEISVAALNQQNNPVIGLPIDFSASSGYIASRAYTDSTGTAETTFSGKFANGYVTISASVPGMNIQNTKEIYVHNPYLQPGSLILTSNRSFIYADNGHTIARLTAVLKDSEGKALSGKQIVFSSNHGSVRSPVLTDEFGIAETEFMDVRLPSVTDTLNILAEITANNYELNLKDEIDVLIRPKRLVEQVILTSDENELFVCLDSLCVMATCICEDGSYAPEGTEVRFEVEDDMGRFVDDRVEITGRQGEAINYYVASNLAGIAQLSAWVDNYPNEYDYGDVYSNRLNIQILPRHPSHVRVSAFPNRLTVNDPNSYSEITATVTDTMNNPAKDGTIVFFSSSLGNLERYVASTENGRASVVLYPGGEAGIAEITAFVEVGFERIQGRTNVTIMSSTPHSIELTIDPRVIAYPGVNSTATMTAWVYDVYGNPVNEAVPVMFQLLDAPPEPAGCNINNQGQLAETLTSEGRARASLNAGQRSGPVLIRAYTWRDEARTDTIDARNSALVNSGPPFAADVDVNNIGEDRQGGTWAVEVSAKVWDLMRNPVDDGIPVSFTVDPEIAHIGYGFTGNENSQGQSTPGVAYTYMIYNSVRTFDTLTITVEVGSPEGSIYGHKEYALPLQGGILTLDADPQTWMIDDPANPDTCSIRVWAILRDGHDVLIDNAPILFRTTRGKFYWYNLQRQRYETFYPDPAIYYTGWNEGTATVFLRGTEYDFFLDGVTPQVNVNLSARVVGYDGVEARPLVVTITRHP